MRTEARVTTASGPRGRTVRSKGGNESGNTSFLLLVRPGAPSSFLLLVVRHLFLIASLLLLVRHLLLLVRHLFLVASLLLGEWEWERECMDGHESWPSDH